MHLRFEKRADAKEIKATSFWNSRQWQWVAERAGGGSGGGVVGRVGVGGTFGGCSRGNSSRVGAGVEIMEGEGLKELVL